MNATTRTSSSRALLRGLALALAAGAMPLPASALPALRGSQVTAFRADGISRRVDFVLGEYRLRPVAAEGQRFTRLDVQGGVRTNRKGWAELPFYHATLQMPQGRSVKVVVESEEHEDIQLDLPLLPSKGILYRNQKPSQVPYAIAPESQAEGFYPATAAELSEPFQFRDERGVNVYIRPFQYDASTGTLRVYRKLSLRLVEEGALQLGEVAADRAIKPAAETESMYRSLFLDYTPASGLARWSNEVAEVGDMLVIHTSRDASAIAPYVQWKREKGHKVKTVQVATGTNVKATIQSEYAANPRLLYVQLVGDWADLKSDIGTSQSKPMDPALGCVAGSDNYPDLIIGRFSGSTTAHITAQVNKAIAYEKSPEAGGTWYKKGLVIASSEGAGQGDDSESDIQHETAIRDYRMLNHTYSSVTGALGDSSAKSTVTGAFNSGASLVNYTGHGSDTYWGTTGFSTTDAAGLTNASRPAVICSVACVVGSFSNSSDCLAEALLKNANGGAVAGMFATINQPWTPPMRGQDYFNDMLAGGYTYGSHSDSGTSTSYGRATVGSAAVNAMVLMYAESNGTDDLETIQTWTTFGDASLQVRTDTPAAIAVSSETLSPSAAFTTRVTKGGAAASGALVSLCQGDVVASGLTDANGNVTLNHAFTSGTVKLTVTGKNLATISKDLSLGAAALSIASAPQNLTVQSGSIASFAVTAAGGTTPYTYQWYRGGSAISGATGASYSFTASAADNGAAFNVLVKDAAGASVTSGSATLTVTTQAPLAISTQPASANVNAGGTASFTVAATGGTAPYSYQWYRGGSAISGATSATYSFTTAATDNGATFYAVVGDASGASVQSSTATLAVSAAPGGEKILNGGFESGATSWSGTTAAIGAWSGQTAYEGTKCAWLGGNGKTTTETLYQTVTIPSGVTSAVLSFYLHIDTKETTTSTQYDKLVVSLQNSSGTTLKSLATYSNLNKSTGYTQKSFDVTAYKGQTIRVYFKATEDSSLQTSFVVDKVSLIVR